MIVTSLWILAALMAPATALALYARPVRAGAGVCLDSLRRPAPGGGRDLRFAAFVAALAALVLVTAAGRPAGWSTWAVLAVSALLVAPLTVLEAALADAIGRVAPGTWETARFAARLSGSRALSRSQAVLVEQAHCEVASARTIVQDPSLLAALDTLEEAVADYARAIEEADDGEALDGLRARLKGVTALTRSCFDDSACAEALAAVDRPASDEEVAQVCQQLELASRGSPLTA